MAAETFRVHRKACPFTMVDNELINNPVLSWGAKGVLIYILSKPEGWKIYTQDIVNHAVNQRDSVRAIMKELRKAGYVSLARVINDKGVVVEWRYNVYECPLETPIETYYTVRQDELSGQLSCTDALLPTENPAAGEAPEAACPAERNPETEKPFVAENPETDFPDVASPEVARPDVENPPTSNTKDNNIDITYTQSIYPAPAAQNCRQMEDRSEITETLKQNIEYEAICEAWPEEAEEIQNMVDLMADVLSGGKRDVYINSTPMPLHLVRERYLSLRREHIEYILIAQKRNTVPIRNIRAYWQTVLYNAPSTYALWLKQDVQTCLASYSGGKDGAS